MQSKGKYILNPTWMRVNGSTLPPYKLNACVTDFNLYCV